MDQIFSQIHLNRNIPIPLYYQLKKQMLRLIESGELKEGDMLPPENDLSEAMGVSRPTVRQALGEMVAEGHLHRFKGKGTFVTKPKVDAYFLSLLQSFHQEMQQKGMTPSTVVLKLEKIDAIAAINDKLGIGMEDPLIYLSRVRFADNIPLVYLDTYLPHKAFSRLMDIDYTTASLYSSLEEHYHVRVDRVCREIEAALAGRREAELLNIEPKHAIVLVKTIAYASSYPTPVEYSVARYRGDMNKFSIELRR